MIPVPRVRMEEREGKEDERERAFIQERHVICKDDDIVNLYAVTRVEADERVPLIHPIKIHGTENKLIKVESPSSYGSMVEVMCSRLFTSIRHGLGSFFPSTCQFQLANGLITWGEADGTGGRTGEG